MDNPALYVYDTRHVMSSGLNSGARDGFEFQVKMLCISKGGFNHPPLYFVTRLAF